MGFVSRWSGMLARRWSERKRYGTRRDWLLSLYDRTLKRLPTLALPGRRAVYPVLLAGHEQPLYARLGSSDFLVMEELFFRGEYDFLFDFPLGEVQVVVDLGANCGFSVVLWARHFLSARIVAVEPDAQNLDVLRQNLARSAPQARVDVVQACVTGCSRTVYFDRSQGEWAYTAYDTPLPGAEPMCSLTLPQVLERCGVEGPIDLLKCDIEGSEEDLFAAAGDWLHRVRHVIVEVHPPYTVERLAADVARAGGGFRITPVGPPKGNQVFFLTRG